MILSSNREREGGRSGRHLLQVPIQQFSRVPLYSITLRNQQGQNLPDSLAIGILNDL